MEGCQFAAYTLQEKLGSGGMGAVYRASDSRIGRTVAIKIIRPDNLLSERARERFAREARSIGALNHPNIATLYDVSLSGETPFIVMEYLPGGSLSHRLSRGRLPLPEILRWAIQIGAGLEHAHAHGVIHRDLKPANILFTADGTPKVIDFGLALMPDSSELTLPGTMMGTAEYMSPEQASGKTVDLRSDIFSFGVILYHMATGQNPFSCTSVPATLHRIVNDPAPPLASVRPDLPETLTRLVGKMIEKLPEDRPRSLTSVVQDLRLVQTSLDTADTKTMTVARVPSRASPNRYRRPAAALLLCVLIVLAIGAGWWFRNRRLHPALPATRQLVILPFESLNHNPSDQAFCDGVVELLTSSLSQIERFHNTLWVIPSADVRHLQLHDVSGVHKALPVVNLAVTGSLQTDGGQLLVIINLADTATTRQIASRIIPVSANDRTRLPQLLNLALMDMLDLGSAGGEGVVPGAQTKVPSAYDSYLQGKGFLQHSEVPANVDRAIYALEKSVRLDPTFALAQATLADAYLRRYASTRDKEWLAKADQMAHQSLDLDGKQAFVHLVLGRICHATGQFDQAIAEIQRAIAYQVATTSRQVVHYYPRTIIGHTGPFLGMFFGLDNSELVPPFLPMGRGEDDLFGATLDQCVDESYCGFLPFNLAHLPANRRRYAGIRPLSINQAGIMAILIGAHNHKAFPVRTDDRLKNLGRYLIQIGSLPQRDFDEFIRTNLIGVFASRVGYLESLLRRFGEGPRYWTEVIKNSIHSVRAGIDKPTIGVPAEWRTSNSLPNSKRELRDLVRLFGELLYWWPPIVEGAKQLVKEGQRIGQRVR